MGLVLGLDVHILKYRTATPRRIHTRTHGPSFHQLVRYQCALNLRLRRLQGRSEPGLAGRWVGVGGHPPLDDRSPARSGLASTCVVANGELSAR